MTNQADQSDSSILGGYGKITEDYNSTISGGAHNATDADSPEGSVLGGNENEVVGNCATFPATGQSC